MQIDSEIALIAVPDQENLVDTRNDTTHAVLVQCAAHNVRIRQVLRIKPFECTGISDSATNVFPGPGKGFEFDLRGFTSRFVFPAALVALGIRDAPPLVIRRVGNLCDVRLDETRPFHVHVYRV
ncbi:MAG: hypothetical protein ACKJSG_18650, partial [Lentisphaeria bacterium]